TGSAHLVFNSIGSAIPTFRRCVFAHARGAGFQNSGGSVVVLECEAYDCNQSNTANLAGFAVSNTTASFVRCLSHDHASGANCHGFISTNVSLYLTECAAFNCGGSGVLNTNNSAKNLIKNSDFYNNTGDGLKAAEGGGSSTWYIENC